MSGGRSPAQKSEEWRQLAIAPEYAVSEFGRVMRLVTTPGSRACRELKFYVTDKGYSRCVLRVNKSSITARVHRLVCEAFHGPPPPERPMVRHLDGNPGNNHFSNLTWGNAAENAADKYLHGRAVDPPGLAERRAQTNCAHGHEFSLENTYVHSGRRHCKACRRNNARNAARRAA